jgi:hypothetical protein
VKTTDSSSGTTGQLFPKSPGHGVGRDDPMLSLEMDVDLARHSFRGVTERLTDDLHGDAHGEKERSGRVAELVNGPGP